MPLLPNAEQQFIDANGAPYAAGTVDFYLPGTLTRKDTWQDAGFASLNTNPIILDAAGRAIIYGDGTYRQILRDAAGNLVWDQLTDSLVSRAMAPVVAAPTIAEAQRLLGIGTDLAQALADETAARIAADNAEQAARIAADNAEQAARTAADTAETSRAQAAEANLQSEIDAERAARIAGDAANAVVGGTRAGQTTANASGQIGVTFAPAFATACVVAVVPPDDAVAGPGVLAGLSQGNTTITRTSFTGLIVDGAGNPMPGRACFWYAIGY
jgi:hypothetical protein